MTVICLTHGPMLRREACRWWGCAGFDGEGCGTGNVTDEAIRGGTEIPNTEVRL